MSGSVLSYCGCKDPATGNLYRTGKCPRWTQRGHRKWAFIIDLPKVYDPDQDRWKRQQLKHMGFATRRDAELALEAEVPAIRNHTAPTLADRTMTVGEWLNRWLSAAVKARGEPWRPSTRTAYGRDVRLYLRPGLGQIRLVDLRSDDIGGLWARMRGDGRSAQTISAAYGTLNAALNAAVLAERITRNPCVAARVADPGRPDIQVWEPEHVTVFLAHARQEEPGLAPAYQLAAWRGLRRGELMGLRWSDLDLDAGLLHVRRNVTEAGGQLHVGEPKTARGTRTVSLGPLLVAALRAHRKRQAAARLAAGQAWQDNGLVFPSPDGRLLQPHVLTQTFKRLVRELPDLPDLHLHGLRHTAATTMLLAGVAPKVVQDQLGHATLAMTMDTYGHVIPRQRDASADAIERLYGTDPAPR